MEFPKPINFAFHPLSSLFLRGGYSGVFTQFTMRVEINKYIVADTEICHGKPTFKGTRVMVWQVLEMLEGGMSIKKILNAFLVPLTKEHIKAALHYASIITKRGVIKCHTKS